MLRPISLALGVWVGTTSLLAAQEPAAVESATARCLQSAQDSCLADLLLSYAEEGGLQADLIARVLGDNGIWQLLLRRCRPLHPTLLMELHALLEEHEPTWRQGSPERADEIEAIRQRAASDRALNIWLASPHRAYEPTGFQLGQLRRSNETENDPVWERLVELFEVVTVEGSCGDRERALDALALLTEELDRSLETLPVLQQITMLYVLAGIQQGEGDAQGASVSAQEILRLTPQLDSASVGEALMVLEIARDLDIDVATIAAHWDNSFVAATAAFDALGRRDPETNPTP